MNFSVIILIMLFAIMAVLEGYPLWCEKQMGKLWFYIALFVLAFGISFYQALGQKIISPAEIFKNVVELIKTEIKG